MKQGTEIVTFGCRLNTYESEVMRSHAEKAGLDNAIVFNTCAVTADAVRQARQTIRRLRRDNPHARIVVSGCAAQTEPETFAGMDEVDAVIGNDAKGEAATYRKLPDFGVSQSEKIRVNDIMSVRETAGHLVEGLEGRARAFVQVQNGCDHRCTFCIIPYGRGPSRSVPAGEVVAQVRALVENGYREVVLTGVDMTSYGGDLPGRPSLGNLARRILKLVPDLERLRLSSIDSIEADDEPDAGSSPTEERLMPHLHLSLQAWRRHDSEADETAASARRFDPLLRGSAASAPGHRSSARISSPAFRPRRTSMFENTMRLVDECGLTWLHVFPFSPRPGTPAAKMPQVARERGKRRAEKLRTRVRRASPSISSKASAPRRTCSWSRRHSAAHINSRRCA